MSERNNKDDYCDDSTGMSTPSSDSEKYFATIEEENEDDDDSVEFIGGADKKMKKVANKGGNNSDEQLASAKKMTNMVTQSPRTNWVDRFLAAYVQFTSGAYAQDKGLKLLQYTLWAASRFFPVKASLSSSSSSSASTPMNKNQLHQESLMKISGQISWTRYFNRLFGLLASVEAVRSNSWGPGWIGKGMAWSMIGYYPLEHLALVKWMAPNSFLPKQKQLASKASAWSCRFWVLYIALDVIRSVVELNRMKKDNQQQAVIASQEFSKTSNGQNYEVIEQRKKQQQRRRAERLQIIRNALFTLPGIHWSLSEWDTNPWLSEDLVNLLMWLESIVCFYQGIDNFRSA